MAGGEPLVSGFGAAMNRATATLQRQGFNGDLGQIADLSDGLIAVGLGKEVNPDSLRNGAGVLGRHLGRLDRLGTSLHLVPLSGAVEAVVEGFGLGSYRFDRYRSRKGTEHIVELHGANPSDVERALIGVEAESFARDLVNTPAADKAPSELAAMIGERVRGTGIEADIWDRDRLVQEEMAGTLAVAAGSDRAPRFVRLNYHPAGANFKLCLVGKGIVFDSGGLSLKPADAMEPMKTDMSGAAAVAAAMWAIARRRLKINVEGYLPLTDNMPGGLAIKPGDVIRYRNGRTIEVLNTDAEGRLVLADGLVLASESTPDLVVDIATLTGAQRIALGDRVGAVLGNELASSAGDIDLVIAAGAVAGERLWEMPMVRDYRSLIESQVADVKNTAGRYGGVIAAALILEPFAGSTRWVHVDIAGPARAEKPHGWYTAGGTGFGTRTLIALAEILSNGQVRRPRRG
jgi:leucyl aminopeptidase